MKITQKQLKNLILEATKINESRIIESKDMIKLSNFTKNIGGDMRYGDVINIYYDKNYNMINIESFEFAPSGTQSNTLDYKIIKIKPDVKLILIEIKKLLSNIREPKPSKNFYCRIYNTPYHSKQIDGISAKLMKQSLDSVLSLNENKKIIKEAKDPAVIKIMDQIWQFEEDILHIEQILEFDEPYGVEEIAELVNDENVKKMRRSQVMKNKQLLSKAKKALDQRNNAIYKKINNLEKILTKKFPGLKKLKNVPITDITGIYKNGRTWTIITPDEYHDDHNIDLETAKDIKRFIIAKGIKIKNNKARNFITSKYD